MFKAFTQYNAAIADAVGNAHPMLPVGQQQAAPFVHSSQGQVILALSGPFGTNP